jgi:hypothetical protein
VCITRIFIIGKQLACQLMAVSKYSNDMTFVSCFCHKLLYCLVHLAFYVVLNDFCVQGLCKLGSFGGGDASIKTFAEGSNSTLAKACRR